MEHIGIDVHARESQVCILTESGEIVERRIRTQRERFAALLSGRAPARILIEASTESEWVGRCLEQLGHEVIVADPNLAAMYATRSRRVKTDRRDSRTLAEACRLGAYRRAHRTSDAPPARRNRHKRYSLSVAPLSAAGTARRPQSRSASSRRGRCPDTRTPSRHARDSTGACRPPAECRSGSLPDRSSCSCSGAFVETASHQDAPVQHERPHLDSCLPQLPRVVVQEDTAGAFD
jgi:transposase